MKKILILGMAYILVMGLIIVPYLAISCNTLRQKYTGERGVSSFIDIKVTTNSYSDYQILKFDEVVGGYLSGSGDRDYYKVYVPYNTQKLTLYFDVSDYPPSPWSVNNSDPESVPLYICGSYFKMYVKHGSVPTTSSYDYASTGDIVISNPAAGAWYIMIYSHYGSGMYTLKASVTLEMDGITQRYAIIVGISDYLNLDSSHDLQYADEDANDWYYQLVTYLDDPFDSSNVYVLGDNNQDNYIKYDGIASENNIIQTIQNILAQLDGDDKLVFVFSGHGYYDNVHSYLYAYDAGSEPADLESEDGFISDVELARELSYSAAKVFVFLDACHSGGFSEPATTNSNKKNILVLTATTAEDTTKDDDTVQNGVWTYGFLDSWRTEYENSVLHYLEDIYDYTKNYNDWYDLHKGNDDPQIFDGSPSDGFNLSV